MKKLEYKIVVGDKGFAELENKVSDMLNQGWKPIGGVAFNNGFAHQAMARIYTEERNTTKNNELENSSQATKSLSANEALKRLDDLT